MSKMSTPTTLLVSCSTSVDPHEIVQKITQEEDHTMVCPIAEDVEGFPWQLSNKYYTADILLCVAPPCVMGSLTLGDSMEGLVIVIDDQEPSFKSAKSQWSTVKEMNPEVRILACKQFTKSPGVSKKDVLEWCLDHAFELVELEKPEDEEEEEEDGFGVEPYGVKRIISALHAHTWSNLEMKDDNGSNLLRLQERFGETDHHGQPGESTHNTDSNGYIPLISDGEHSAEEQEVGNQNNTDQSAAEAERTEPPSARTEADNERTQPSNERTEPSNSRTGADSEIERTSNNSAAVGDVSDGHGDGGCHGNSASTESRGAVNESSNQSAGNGAEGSKEDEKKKAEGQFHDTMTEDAKLFEALGNEVPGSECFEQLFSRMALMKEKASSLEGEERRRYAEQVAVAFWKAIGGDEGEIDGLGDDSD